jgi:fructose-bisphosphate aldolase class I
MTAQKLTDTAQALVADDKGVLAMDESNPTCNKRFAKLNIPQTVEARRAYRELADCVIRECYARDGAKENWDCT